MSDSKPNILLIEADQMAAFVLSMYQSVAQAITPDLDKLAAEGVVFENAYSNSPICCPSRASKFTGSLPSSHEVWGNSAEFRSEFPTMMHFLSSAGYRCVVSGKCHFIGLTSYTALTNGLQQTCTRRVLTGRLTGTGTHTSRGHVNQKTRRVRSLQDQ